MKSFIDQTINFYVNASKKLENIIFFGVILFIFKILFTIRPSSVFITINEFLVFITLGAITIYLVGVVKVRIVNPIPIIINMGIFNAIIFFFSSVSTKFGEDSVLSGSQKGLFKDIVIVFVVYMIIFSTSYIFATLKELFSLRQKKDNSSIFNTMVVFMVVTSFANTVYKWDSSLSYIRDAFWVVTIILIFINSLKVAWIAFLQKKQKLYLLFLSVILFTIFIFNSIFSFDSFLAEELVKFSPALSFFVQIVMLYGAIYFGVIFFTALFHLPTAEVFDRKAEELSSMMDLSNLMTQVFDFKELAESVTTTTNKVCNSDSAWLLTYENNQLNLSAVTNISIVEAEKISEILLRENKGKLNEVKTLHHEDFRIQIQNDTKIVKYKSIAFAPLKVQNKTNGFLFAAKKDNYSFDDDDKKAISSYADYAAVALENAKLIKESLEKERMEKELDVAREVQYKLLPHSTPKFDNLETAATFIPAFEVGGDYYDFFNINENLLGFVVADVSGKGISAAFIMAEIKGIFQSLAKILQNPREIIIKANETLKHSLDKKTFITAIYGTIELNTGKVSLVRAGHTPVIYCNHNKIDLLTPKGIGLGLDFGEKFINNLKELEFYLKNDDILVLYSDGISESKNSKFEDFGIERLTEVIRENCDKPIDEIANKIMKEISLFSQDYKQHDDITLVIFKWNFRNK